MIDITIRHGTKEWKEEGICIGEPPSDWKRQEPLSAQGSKEQKKHKIYKKFEKMESAVAKQKMELANLTNQLRKLSSRVGKRNRHNFRQYLADLRQFF